MRAMVVDDSRAMRTILRRLLTDCGYDEIVEAGDGREALGLLVAHSPVGLALVDWNMPEMTGIEFVREVRADRTYDETVLVMITTETSIDRIQEALDAGADEYVMKPFTRDALLDKLELVRSARG